MLLSTLGLELDRIEFEQALFQKQCVCWPSDLLLEERSECVASTQLPDMFSSLCMRVQKNSTSTFELILRCYSIHKYDAVDIDLGCTV